MLLRHDFYSNWSAYASDSDSCSSQLCNSNSVSSWSKCKNPYFIHHSDHTSLVLVPDLLTDENLESFYDHSPHRQEQNRLCWWFYWATDWWITQFIDHLQQRGYRLDLEFSVQRDIYESLVYWFSARNVVGSQGEIPMPKSTADFLIESWTFNLAQRSVFCQLLFHSEDFVDWIGFISSFLHMWTLLL